MRDSEHEFRNVGDILDDVAVKWNKLDSVEQNQIATAISGTYNRNTFIATMENYSRVTELATESTQAQGVAEKKYEAVLDSVETKLNQLTATWEKFVNNLNQSGTMKDLIELGIKAVDILDLIVNKTGLLNIALVGIAGVGLLKVENGLKGLFNDFTRIGEIATKTKGIFASNSLELPNVQLSTKSLQDYGILLDGLPKKIQAMALKSANLNDTQLQTVLSTLKMTDADKSLLLQMVKNSSSFNTLTKQTLLFGKQIDLTAENVSGFKKTLGIANNVAREFGLGFSSLLTTFNSAILIIGAVNAVWQWHKKKVEETKQAYEDTVEEVKNFNKETASNFATLESNKDRFEKLSKGVSEYGQNISLTAEEYREYKNIIADIVEMAPSLIEGYDAEGNAIVRKNGLIERTIELLKEQRKIEIEDKFSSSNYEKTVKGADTEYKEAVSKKITDLAKPRQNVLDTMDSLMAKTKDATQLGFESVQEFNDLLIHDFPKAIQIAQNSLDRLYKSEVITKKEFDDANKAFNAYSHQLSASNREVESAAHGLDTLYRSVPQLVDGFESLSPELQALATEFGTTFNFKNGNVFDPEEVMDGIKTFTDILVNGIGDIDIGAEIQKLFELDKSSFSADIFASKIERTLNELFEKVDMDEAQKKEIMSYLKIALGVEIVDQNGNSVSSLETGIEHIMSNLKNVTEGQLRGLSQEEFEMAVKIAPTLDPNSSFQDLLDAIRNKINEATYEMANFNQIGSEFADSVSNSFSQLEILNTALDQFNTYGYLAADTFKSITDNNLLEYLNWTTNGLEINTQAFLDNAEAARQKSLEELNVAYTESVVALANQTLAMSDEDLAQAEVMTAQTTVGLAQDLANLGNTAIQTANIVSMAVSAMDSQIKQMTAKQRAYFDTELNKITQQYNAVRNAMISSTDAVQTTAKHIGGLTKDTKTLNKEATAAGKAAKNAAKNATDALKDAKKEISDLISKLKDSQSSVDDLIQMTIKMLKQQYTEQKEAIEKQKEALEELHDKEKEAIEKETEAYEKKLDLEREFLKEKEKEYEYQKDLEDKRNDISKIQSDLDAIQFDNSIAGQKKKLELAQELADKQEELDDFQHDHGIEVAEDALDKEEERFKELQETKLNALEEEYKKNKDLLEKRIKEIEEYVKKEYNLWLEAIALIDGKTDAFYQDLIAWNKEYG